jgi:hypothetical protein
MKPPAPRSPPNAELVDAVRNYVHFDNLAEALTKQVTNARAMRKTNEEKILTMLDSAGMKTAVLQINGASLQRQTEFKPRDLSWSLLEEQLNAYYKGRPQNEAKALLEFIQKNRGGKTTEYIKKTLAADTHGKKPPGV